MNILRNVVFAGGLLVCAFSASAQTRSSDAPPPLSAFGKRPDIEEVALSPDGKRMALIKDAGSERLLLDIDMETKGFKLLRIGDVKIRSLFWGDEDHIILISSQTADLRDFVGGKDEYYLGQILDLPNNKAFTLYKGIEGYYPIVMGDFQRVRVNGRYKVTASNVKLVAEGLRSLYSFDLNTGRGTRIEEEPYHVQDWLLTPEGELLARSEFDRDTKVWKLRYRDTQRGKWSTIYESKHMLDAPSLMGRGRADDTLLIYISDGGGGYYEIGPEGKLSDPVEAKGNSVSPYFHPVTRKLAGFVNVTPDGPVYSFFAPDMAQLPRLIEKGMPDATYRKLVAVADDPRKIVVYSEGPGDPGSYYFVDYANRSFKHVGETRPAVPSEWVSPKTKISYKSADGLEIEAFLTLPPEAALKGRDTKSLPLVVVPHGGPQSYDDISYDWMSQALASRGYAVLQANFRGSDGYGQAFVEKGYGEFGRKMQTDLSDGVRHLAAQGLIDPKRVCIAGASYGGYAALAGAAFDPGVYRCASATAPVTNLKAFVNFQQSTVGYDSKATRVLYWKRFLGEPSGWDAVSPDVKAENITIPIQLIHGKDDTVVPIEQTYRMRDALKKAGNPAEVVILDGEDHWLSREPTRVQTLSAIVAFIEKHNPAY